MKKTYLLFLGLDGCLIITTPQEVALLDVRKQVDFCRKVNLPILGFIENMSGFKCPSCAHQSIIWPALSGTYLILLQLLKRIRDRFMLSSIKPKNGN